MMKRSFEKELLDLGLYTKEEYDDCLHQLGKIGYFLGGDRASLKTFDQLIPFKTVLDVGCGGGQFALLLGKRFPEIQVTGIDISADAIEFAKKRLEETGLKNMTFEVSKSPELLFPENSFDVVTATLVCHHLTDEELVSFLKRSLEVARKYVVINDLHRHCCAYGLFAVIGTLFRNRLIYHDGLLSIKRSFTKQDWIDYLTLAGIPLESCEIKWHFAFRWVICITK